MKHHKSKQPSRQSGKPVSKPAAKLAARKTEKPAKAPSTARKPAAKPAKKATWKSAAKPAAKVASKQANKQAKKQLPKPATAPPVVGKEQPRPSVPSNPLRPHVGPHYVDPIDYPTHPYPSMKRFAEHLALGNSMPRTRHCYYRDLRLVQEYFNADPATLTEDQFRGYVLYVKTKKMWEPKTIRQTAASAKRFFVDMLGYNHWTVFSQIHAKDHEKLPAVLTRDEVRRLLGHQWCRIRDPISASCPAKGNAWGEAVRVLSSGRESKAREDRVSYGSAAAHRCGRRATAQAGAPA